MLAASQEGTSDELKARLKKATPDGDGSCALASNIMRRSESLDVEHEASEEHEASKAAAVVRVCCTCCGHSFHNVMPACMMQEAAAAAKKAATAQASESAPAAGPAEEGIPPELEPAAAGTYLAFSVQPAIYANC